MEGRNGTLNMEIWGAVEQRFEAVKFLGALMKKLFKPEEYTNVQGWNSWTFKWSGD